MYGLLQPSCLGWKVDENRKRVYTCAIQQQLASTLKKDAIQVLVVSPRGKELLNRSFTRTKFAEFLGKQKPSLVAFESCASAHYWARAAVR